MAYIGYKNGCALAAFAMLHPNGAESLHGASGQRPRQGRLDVVDFVATLVACLHTLPRVCGWGAKDHPDARQFTSLVLTRSARGVLETAALDSCKVSVHIFSN